MDGDLPSRKFFVFPLAPAKAIYFEDHFINRKSGTQVAKQRCAHGVRQAESLIASDLTSSNSLIPNIINHLNNMLNLLEMLKEMSMQPITVSVHAYPKVCWIHTCSSAVSPPLKTHGSWSPDINASRHPLLNPAVTMQMVTTHYTQLSR